MKRRSQRRQSIPLIVASNCSLGVNVLTALVETAARALSDFDVEVFEIHHIKSEMRQVAPHCHWRRP